MAYIMAAYDGIQTSTQIQTTNQAQLLYTHKKTEGNWLISNHFAVSNHDAMQKKVKTLKGINH